MLSFSSSFMWSKRSFCRVSFSMLLLSKFSSATSIFSYKLVPLSISWMLFSLGVRYHLLRWRLPSFFYQQVRGYLTPDHQRCFRRNGHIPAYHPKRHRWLQRLDRCVVFLDIPHTIIDMQVVCSGAIFNWFRLIQFAIYFKGAYCGTSLVLSHINMWRRLKRFLYIHKYYWFVFRLVPPFGGNHFLHRLYCCPSSSEFILIVIEISLCLSAFQSFSVYDLFIKFFPRVALRKGWVCIFPL